MPPKTSKKIESDFQPVRRTLSSAENEVVQCTRETVTQLNVLRSSEQISSSIPSAIGIGEDEADFCEKTVEDNLLSANDKRAFVKEGRETIRREVISLKGKIKGYIAEYKIIAVRMGEAKKKSLDDNEAEVMIIKQCVEELDELGRNFENSVGELRKVAMKDKYLDDSEVKEISKFFDRLKRK